MADPVKKSLKKDEWRLMYPFTDMVSQNNTIIIPLNMPTKLPEKTDIKLSAIATATGVIITTSRGWLEDD